MRRSRLFHLVALWLSSFAAAGVVDVQDDDAGMVYSGFWLADASPNAHGGHETWTNATGASVFYDFTGTQVKVFATMRPTGSYLTNVSFVIDGEPPDYWTTTANVEAETFNKLVYTSDVLSSVGLHRITITNLGKIFWFVYLEITTVDAPGTATGGGATSTTSTTPSSTTITAGGNPNTSTRGTSSNTANASATTGNMSTNTRSVGTTSGSTSSGTGGVSSGSTGTQTSDAQTSGSPTTSSQATNSSTGGASGSNVNSSSSSTSRTPLIVGIVVGVLGGIALLVALFVCMRTRAKTRQQALSALAATPFAGPTPPPALLAKDQPPVVAPSPFQRVLSLLAGTRPASDPGYAAPTYAPPASGAYAHSAPPQTNIVAPHDPDGRPLSSVTMRPLPIPPHLQEKAALASAHSQSPPYSPPASELGTPTVYSGTGSGSGASDSGLLLPVTFRRSRDGGVRVAGGPPRSTGPGSDAWTPAEYDAVLEVQSEGSTLPPSYHHYRASGQT